MFKNSKLTSLEHKFSTLHTINLNIPPKKNILSKNEIKALEVDSKKQLNVKVVTDSAGKILDQVEGMMEAMVRTVVEVRKRTSQLQRELDSLRSSRATTSVSSSTPTTSRPTSTTSNTSKRPYTLLSSVRFFLE
jgi:hypothetical protein